MKAYRSLGKAEKKNPREAGEVKRPLSWVCCPEVTIVVMKKRGDEEEKKKS